jgi:hypothetical protein
MPESPSRPILHLFVGLHKTGSSAIRFMLDLHRDLFPAYGFHVPRATMTRYVGPNWNGGHNNLPWEICGNHPVIPNCGSLADLVDEIGRYPERQHIVFSEDLDQANAAQVRRLAEAFAAFDVRVIVFLRRQTEWIYAMAAEENKWFGATSRTEWCRAQAGRNAKLDQHGLCRLWSNAFGTLTIRRYEEVKSRIWEAFLDCCGAPESLKMAFAGQTVPPINSTLDEQALDLIQWASDYAATQGIRPDYFNSLIAPAVAAASTELLGKRKGKPALDSETASRLLASARASDQALAEDFGLAPLSDEPASAAFATGPVTPEQRQSLETMAKLIVAASCEISTRLGNRLRRLGLEKGFSTRLRLDEEIDVACSPWPSSPAAPSPLLEEWVMKTLTSKGDGLYLERKQDNCKVFKRINGSLHELQGIGEEAWRSLLATIQAKAHLNPLSWNNIREGEMRFEQAVPTLILQVRHVLTPEGEIIILEWK